MNFEHQHEIHRATALVARGGGTQQCSWTLTGECKYNTKDSQQTELLRYRVNIPLASTVIAVSAKEKYFTVTTSIDCSLNSLSLSLCLSLFPCLHPLPDNQQPHPVGEHVDSHIVL